MNDETYLPPKGDVAFLEARGAMPKEAVLAVCFLDHVPMWKAGELAGYGSGLKKDPEAQRHCLQSAVSRAARKHGKIVPRIQSLMDQLAHFRQHGEAPGIAGEKEILERLSDVVRTSRDASVISAGKELLNHHGRGRRDEFDLKQILAELVRRVGIEQARVGVGALWPTFLPVLEQIDPQKADETTLRALNGHAHSMPGEQMRQA